MEKIVTTKQIAARTSMLCTFAWKFIFDKKIHSIASLLHFGTFLVLLCIYVALIKWPSVCST